MTGLTIITPTGERPYAFNLCQRMMARQDYSGSVRWIVIDDGEVPSDVTIQRRKWTVEVIRPEPFWKHGMNTQGRNLALGLEAADPKSLIVFWEDDDHYAQNWLSEVALQSEKAELVGEADAIYYNVRTRRWKALGNFEHASLRCSAIRGGAIDTFREVLKTPYDYYDMRLWARHADKHVFRSRLTVGIKGMPGRAGIALGHDGMSGKPDPDGSYLRTLIGSDADWYLKEIEMTQKYVVIKPFRYNARDWKPGDDFIPVKRIDAELHVHAKKVARRTETVPPEPPKKFKVESQTQKLANTIVEKAPEPAPVAFGEVKNVDPIAEQKPIAETTEASVDDDEKPRKRGKLSIGI